jgi:ectoine hydroxylase-related dioxygenase (phytanoyl-CoA dioxygenase family)
MSSLDAKPIPDRESVVRAIDEQGYIVVPGVLEPPFIDRAKIELEHAIQRDAGWHGGSTSYADYGMVLVCSIYGGAFLDLFDNRALMSLFEAVLGPGCIVYAYTSSSMPPERTNYSRRIHRDCPRVIPGYVTNVGATILLDDFTEENGATYYLPGSHRRAAHEGAPSKDEFERGAKRLIAPRGSVFLFNALLWHAGGDNRTKAWRHALTINMCRPFMKQRIDLPRMMESMDLSGASESALQKLGFRAQVPSSREEYYAPPEKRKYRQAVE